MELAERKRQKELALKMKRIEPMDRTSLRGSVSRAIGSFRVEKV